MANTTTQPRAIKPTAFETELTKIVEGVLKNLPPTTSLMLNGAPVKQPVIVSTIHAWLKLFPAVEDAKAQYRDAVNQRLGITVEARAYYKALKAAIKLFFGPQSPLLASFGIATDKPRATTTKAKMVAAAKREQTRAVRGTKGRKARLAVKAVGDPPVTIADGEVQVSAPTVNVASAPASTTPSSPAPAGADSGSATGGSKPPAA